MDLSVNYIGNLIKKNDAYSRNGEWRLLRKASTRSAVHMIRPSFGEKPLFIICYSQYVSGRHILIVINIASKIEKEIVDVTISRFLTLLLSVLAQQIRICPYDCRHSMAYLPTAHIDIRRKLFSLEMHCPLHLPA